MRLVGLTGGIATGKSTFAALLRARGVPVIDADQLAREAVAQGLPGLAEVVAAFGPVVLDAAGALDRKRMAAAVFGDPAARRRLEAIVHPRVRQAMADLVARLHAQGAPLAFYDVPLLFEAGREGDVEAVVVVWAPPEAQRARLAARDGLSAAEVNARLAAQIPIDEKAARADLVVLNDGPPEALGVKADALLADLAAGAGRRAPGAAARRY